MFKHNVFLPENEKHNKGLNLQFQLPEKKLIIEASILDVNEEKSPVSGPAAGSVCSSFGTDVLSTVNVAKSLS